MFYTDMYVHVYISYESVIITDVGRVFLTTHGMLPGSMMLIMTTE